jgi:hypothetical protein
MAKTVTIPENLLNELLEKSARYETIKRTIAEEPFFQLPPTRDPAVILAAFRQAGYSEAFLADLAAGLRRSVANRPR